MRECRNAGMKIMQAMQAKQAMQTMQAMQTRRDEEKLLYCLLPNAFSLLVTL